MHSKIEITHYLSQKIRIISLLAIIMVFIQHGSYGLPDVGVSGVFKHIISFGIADYPVSFFFIVSGYFLSRKFSPSFCWYSVELKKRIRSLLIPYLVYIGVGFLMFDCYSRITILEALGITSLLPAVCSLWYVRTLMILCIISPIIIWITQLMSRNKICMHLGFFIFMIASLIEFPARKSLGMSTLYFTFGTFLGVYGCCLSAISTRVKFVCSITVLFTLLGVKLYHVSTTAVVNSAEVYLRWQIVPATIASIWYGYDLIFKHRSLKLPRWFEFATETTFFVYCIESFLRYGLSTVIRGVGCQTLVNTPLGIIVLAFVIVGLGLVVAYLLQKASPVYKILSGGR